MKPEASPLSDHEINHLGAQLRPYLDAAANNIKPGIAYRLQQARRNALVNLEARLDNGGHVIHADGSLSTLGGWHTRLQDWRFWAVGLMFASALAIYGYEEWSAFTQARDAADIDLMLLGDDLPVDALLDKGFQTFLHNP